MLLTVVTIQTDGCEVAQHAHVYVFGQGKLQVALYIGVHLLGYPYEVIGVFTQVVVILILLGLHAIGDAVGIVLLQVLQALESFLCGVTAVLVGFGDGLIEVLLIGIGLVGVHITHCLIHLVVDDAHLQIGILALIQCSEELAQLAYSLVLCFTRGGSLCSGNGLGELLLQCHRIAGGVSVVYPVGGIVIGDVCGCLHHLGQLCIQCIACFIIVAQEHQARSTHEGVGLSLVGAVGHYTQLQAVLHCHYDAVVIESVAECYTQSAESGGTIAQQIALCIAHGTECIGCCLQLLLSFLLGEQTGELRVEVVPVAVGIHKGGEVVGRLFCCILQFGISAEVHLIESWPQVMQRLAHVHVGQQLRQERLVVLLGLHAGLSLLQCPAVRLLAVVCIHYHVGDVVTGLVVALHRIVQQTLCITGLLDDVVGHELQFTHYIFI